MKVCPLVAHPMPCELSSPSLDLISIFAFDALLPQALVYSVFISCYRGNLEV